jgi:phosphatidylglycerophosphate synthase
MTGNILYLIRMKNKIPIILIYSRLVFGVLIILLSIFKPEFYRATIIVLVALGLASDIFDGIIARRLSVSTPQLRRMDSGADQFFWLCIVGGAYLVSPDFFKTNLFFIILILAFEAACYALSFIKFKKEVATHAIASKIWTIFLFATLIQVIASGNSVTLFYICFWLGILTRLEIISILIILNSWSNDVPTVYHAVLIRKGKPIKKHKLFNG